MRGSPLIDPLPTISVAWAFSVGALIGLFLIYLSPLPMKPHLYLTLPIAFGLLAIPNLEAAVEVYAFHNIAPQTTQRLALIDGTFDYGGKSTTCAGVKVRAYLGARSVSIRTVRSVCNSVSGRSWERPPACFLIDIEMGRNGIKRASAPTNEDRRRQCPVRDTQHRAEAVTSIIPANERPARRRGHSRNRSFLRKPPPLPSR